MTEAAFTGLRATVPRTVTAFPQVSFTLLSTTAWPLVKALPALPPATQLPAELHDKVVKLVTPDTLSAFPQTPFVSVTANG